MVFHLQLSGLVYGMRCYQGSAWLLGEQRLCKASVLRDIRLRLSGRIYIAGNPPALFFAGCVGGTVFEYIVAMVMIKLFGELWWNYDHKRFNYKGILCLQSSLAWGVICVLLFMVINVRIKLMVHAINPMVVRPLAVLLFISYTVDFVHQFYRSLRDKNEGNNTEKMA